MYESYVESIHHVAVKTLSKGHPDTLCCFYHVLLVKEVDVYPLKETAKFLIA
jgi:hypothetical protein